MAFTAFGTANLICFEPLLCGCSVHHIAQNHPGVGRPRATVTGVGTEIGVGAEAGADSITDASAGAGTGAGFGADAGDIAKK